MNSTPALVFLFLAVLAGLATVLQGGLNHQISKEGHFWWVIVVNSFVCLVAAMVALGIQVYAEPFRSWGASLSSIWSWKLLIPGICGFVIISSLPIAIRHVGVAQVLIAMVAAQLLFGLLWDWKVEGMALSWPRLLSVSVALIAVVIGQIKVAD